MRLFVPALVAAALVSAPLATSDTRPMIVHRPVGLARTAPVPLVLVLHGRGGSPTAMEVTTGFDRLADRDGFVVAYLSSTSVGWDSAGWSSTDDLDYIAATINQLAASQNIDRARIYLAGWSSGGFMAYRVACALSGQIAAIAEISGGMASGDLPACRSARPVSVLSIHGDADGAVPIEGAAKLAPLTATVRRWRNVDVCPSNPQTITSGAATTQTWANCSGGTAVSLVLVRGGGHTWPGSPGLDPSSPDGQLDASGLLWSFFAAHPAAKVAALTLIDTTVSRSHHVVLIDLRVGAKGMLTAKVSCSGKRLASRVVSVSPGWVTLRLTLPRRPPKAAYTLQLLSSASDGTRSRVTRNLG